jgi:hypothetical protein
MRNVVAFVALSVTGLAGVACRTVQTTSFSAEALALIKADSEVFDAVVVPHPAAGTKPHLYTLVSAHYDSRPYGRQTGFALGAGGSNGDSPSLFPAADSSTIGRMIKARRGVLKETGLTEGGPFS